MGTFECDENGVIECVPQHLICGGMDECRRKNAVSCLLLFGYFQYIVDIANASLSRSNDTDFLPNCSELHLFHFYFILFGFFSYCGIFSQILLSTENYCFSLLFGNMTTNSCWLRARRMLLLFNKYAVRRLQFDWYSNLSIRCKLRGFCDISKISWKKGVFWPFEENF